jgi:hypothetical protein
MSLLIDQLAAWLQTQGEGTVGATIFKRNRPPAPVACISLHSTGGYPPPPYTRREFPTVQLFARAATPDGAERKAYSLYNRLHRRGNLDLGAGLQALCILAMQSPAYVGEEQAESAVSGGSSQTAHLASFNIVVQLRTPST